MIGLRVAFMGTPGIAVTVLAALIEAGHEIVRVYTQPPRPSGRGHRLLPSPVQHFAETRGLGVAMPATLRDEAVQRDFAALHPDVAVVAAYGLILPRAILKAPRLGCFNVHASLLPRWRGAAPIQRAIMAGDGRTGVTIMRMDEGLDTGPILLAGTVPIEAGTTAETLHDALAALGARLMVEVLEAAAAGCLHPVPQPEEGATYARKIERGEGRLDWRLSAAQLDRNIRALNPSPGSWFEHRGERIRVLAAQPADGAPGAAPGTVLDDAALIACGAGGLRLVRLQRPGRSATDAAAFLRGYALPAGAILPVADS